MCDGTFRFAASASIGRQNGFTLIEAVISIAVTVVGLLAVFQVLASTVTTGRDSRNRAIATHFAERQLEMVRNTPFDALVSTENASHADLDRLAPNATWRQTVAPVAGDSSLLGVRVTVEWRDASQTKSVSLSTLVHRHGINSIRDL